MQEVKTIVLEDNEYMIIGELNINGAEYIHFAKVDDPKDFCIRKVEIIEGEETIVGLDSKEEFDMALRKFSEKHIKEL